MSETNDIHMTTTASVSPAEAKSSTTLVASSYRPDIDGLRAVAVAFVIAYHSGWLPGGFVGVDIFFVISGYVVTKSILRSGTAFRLSSFYARRIKRLTPALLANLVVGALLLLWFVPVPLQRDGLTSALCSAAGIHNVCLSIVGTWTFPPMPSFLPPAPPMAVAPSNNLTRLVTSPPASPPVAPPDVVAATDDDDYFAQFQRRRLDDAEPNGRPLTHAFFQGNLFLHTWSLGVEEQFYVVYPWLLVCVPVSARVWSLGVALGLSLVLCAVLSVYEPSLAFYLMPSRFWQLGSGGLLLLLEPKVHLTRVGTHVLDILTLSLFGVGLWVASPAQFPLPTCLPVTLASWGFLLLGSDRAPCRAMVSWVCTARPLVYLGLLSYPIYLWHWTLAVGFQWSPLGLDSVATKVSTAILAIVFGSVTYHHLEDPVRKVKVRHEGRLVLAYLPFLVASLVGSAVLLALRYPVPDALPPLTPPYTPAPALPALLAQSAAPMAPPPRSPPFVLSEFAVVAPSVASTCPQHHGSTLSCRCVACAPTHFVPVDHDATASVPCFAYHPEASSKVSAIFNDPEECFCRACRRNVEYAFAQRQVHRCLTTGTANATRLLLLGNSAAGSFVTTIRAALPTRHLEFFLIPGARGLCSPATHDEHKYAILNALPSRIRAGDAVAIVCEEDVVSTNVQFSAYLDVINTLIWLTKDLGAQLLLLPNVPWIHDHLPLTYSSGNLTFHRHLQATWAWLARTNAHVLHMPDTLTTSLLCPDGKCTRYVPGTDVFAYGDRVHLTDSGGLYLAPFWNCYFRSIGWV